MSLSVLKKSRLLREILTRRTSVLGLPATDRTLVLRRKLGAGEYTYELISPCSITDNSPEPSAINGNSRYSPYRVVYLVQGISRLKYPERTGLVGADLDYLLNPKLINGKWFGGTPLKLESFEESPTSWTLNLSEKPAEQNLYREHPEQNW